MSAEDIQERLQAVRKFPPNVSYFAFTTTPKHSTLTQFGRPADPTQPVSSDNPPQSFHVYTMQQAIGEGFILDVLRNYTAYKTAFKLGQAIEDDKRVVSWAGSRRARRRCRSSRRKVGCVRGQPHGRRPRGRLRARRRGRRSCA